MGRVEGTGANGVLLLGESLGDNEVREGGLPFRPNAPAGSVLERAIRRIGATREQFVLFNAVPCQPPHNKLSGTRYESVAIEWGRSYVEEVIDRFHPRVIVALGAVPTRAVTGMCGDKMSISHLAGYFVPGLRESYPPVVMTFHPSFLRRGKMSYFGVLMRALRLAIQIAREGRQPVLPPLDNPPAGYIMHPTLEVAQEFCYTTKHTDAALAVDIETRYSDNEDEAEENPDAIKSIQFSLAPGSGIFMPWREPYIEVARNILTLPNDKLTWNGWRFDNPLLRENGCSIAGTNVDLMWAWHHWQPDLPRKLQFALSHQGPRLHDPTHSWPYPYKHLSHVNEAFYGIEDVAALQWMVSYD